QTARTVVAIPVFSARRLPRFFSWRGSEAFVAMTVRAAADAKPVARENAKVAAPAPSPPDHATVERFSTLMLPHLDAAYNFARYLTRGGDYAEDIVHDAYARALNAFGAYRGGDAKSWLLTIVRNCFVNSVRRRPEIAASDEMSEIADDADTPET